MDRLTPAFQRGRRRASMRRLWRYLAGSGRRSAHPDGVAEGAAASAMKPLKPVDQLQPERISGLLGRWRCDESLEASLLRRIKPRSRFVLIGLAATILLLILAFLNDSLTYPRGMRTAVGLILHPAPAPAHVSLALLQDPVGLIADLVTLLTPVLFAEQATAIQLFNQANERNIAYRADSLDRDRINAEVSTTNDHFSAVGSPRSSFVFLVASAGLSAVVIYLIDSWGLFPSWNKTNLSAGVWMRRVYVGWWANPHSHILLTIALWALGCYFFYFVLKQVAMGAFFAVYIKRISLLHFGVSPNMSANTDGFWGLRQVRRFMLATYSSSLCHTIMVLAILVVWLPFNAFTVFIVALILVINVLVVIYPSVVGSVGARDEKIRYAQHVLGGDQTPADKVALVEQIWNRPNLPFQPRSALTAITIYLVFPLLLAIGSQLLTSY